MKKNVGFLLAVMLLISGCSYAVQVMTPAPVATIGPSGVQSGPVPVTPVWANVTLGVATPTTIISVDDLFFGAFFTVNAVNGPGQPSFPAGTKQIFAIWNYQNMQAGMNVRREWYLNGQLWLTHEALWDFAKYGANGTIHDISIYDLNIGLPSGAYQLKVYVDNVLQPIGTSMDGRPEPWANFEILPGGSILEAASPDAQWDAAVLNNNTLIVRDIRRIPNVLYVGKEIPVLAWLPDNLHLLFVDRDRSGQQGTTTLGIHDDLWIADIRTGDAHPLYNSDTMLGTNVGFISSPDSRFIASTEGSGYGDACMVDRHLIFLDLNADLRVAKVIKQNQFTGFPVLSDGSLFPDEPGAWKDAAQYFTKLKGTCARQSQPGMYSFDMSNLNVKNLSLGISTPTPGDLGWGTVHGTISNAATGTPIFGATVTCQHGSYTSPYPCSGSTVTDASGKFLFAGIFFHDTDTIKLTVMAPGYRTQEFTQTSFTMPDLDANISLTYAP